MSELEKIKGILEKLTNVERTGEAINEGEIAALVSDFSVLESSLREYIQKITREKIVAIISKLRKNQSLTTEELQYVELWIVGDAKFYTQLENNFKEWIAEMNRIIDELKGYAGREIDLALSSRIRALARDATRNASDIQYFVTERERIKKFRESCAEIDAEESKTLIDILQSKMVSDTH